MVKKILTRVKIEEWYATILSFIYCFCILSSYYVIRPVRDQLAVEVGSQHLPLFFGVTFVFTVLMTQMFAWMVSRWPRRVIMPVVYVFFIIIQMAFIPLWNNRELLSVEHLGLIFFVWVSVFNLSVISVFWSFMTDIWSEEQARRLFPMIAVGGTLGAVAGPIITRSLVELIHLPWLLVVSAMFLFLAIICIWLLGKWAHQYGANRHKKGNEAPIGGGVIDGLKQIFTNPFIANMSIIMLLSDAIGTIAYVLVTDYSGMAFAHNPVAQTRFAANMDLASNLLQVILQLTVTRWLLINYGPGFIFIISSIVVIALSLMMAFMENPFIPVIGIFPIVAIVLIISRALAHSMLQSARETLYTLVSRDLRYKGKNAVDTVVWRAGDVMSLLSINAFRNLGVTASGFGFIWALAAGISGWIGWRLSNRVEKGEFEKSH